ncbi:WG repeat-containing protein [Larkinella soli]|uniref:WG repeat-containing protein n=1 Tax=Larkinella soli TaxID=1770527 RepID=UPI001E292C31|nr:WG repeat-containing protein [Larkinella soli]
MTLDELRERIKNEVVLHEGEVADWQWRQKGLVGEAERLGVPPADFNRLVVDVSRQVNSDFAKISSLKEKILLLGQLRDKQLTEKEVNQFVTEAERLQLSRAFVTEQWIPAILEKIPDSAPPAPIVPTPIQTESAAPRLPATSEKPADAPRPADPAPKEASGEAVKRKIKGILDDYDKHIPAQSLKFLFKAVDYDETALAEEIRRYLSEHYYASVHPPKGTTLKEKLLSTDWRHLSWWEKEQSKTVSEPAAAYVRTPTGYTSAPVAPAVGGPLPSVAAAQVPVPPVPAPAGPSRPPEKRSGLSDAALIGLAVLTALVLVWVMMRLVRPESDPEPQRPTRKSNPTRKISTNREAGRSEKSRKSSGNAEKTTVTPADLDEDSPETIAGDAPAVTVNEKNNTNETARPYDEVDDRPGEFGLRPARKGDRWGFVDEQDVWVIRPKFDIASPFNNGKASVELNGSQFFIDRDGRRLTEDR